MVCQTVPLSLGHCSLACSLPKLDSSAISRPYVSSFGEISVADPWRLVEQDTRKSAGHLRIVEDPISIKINLEKASDSPSSSISPMRKISHFILEAELNESRLGSLSLRL